MKFEIGQSVYYAALQRQVTVIDYIERAPNWEPAYKVEDAEGRSYFPVDEDELT